MHAEPHTLTRQAYETLCLLSDEASDHAQKKALLRMAIVRLSKVEAGPRILRELCDMAYLLDTQLKQPAASAKMLAFASSLLPLFTAKNDPSSSAALVRDSDVNLTTQLPSAKRSTGVSMRKKAPK